MAKLQDLPVGSRFGKWTTRGHKWKRPGETHYSVSVQCDCGSIKVVKAYLLTSGQATRCWDCYNAERPSVLSAKETLINTVYNSYVKSARKRGYSFDIEKRRFAELIFDDCWYCDRGPSNVMTDRRKNPVELPKYNGLDRVENHLGYTLDNVVPCCRWCNEAKKAKTTKEFLEWIDGLTKNFPRTKLLL